MLNISRLTRTDFFIAVHDLRLAEHVCYDAMALFLLNSTDVRFDVKYVVPRTMSTQFVKNEIESTQLQNDSGYSS